VVSPAPVVEQPDAPPVDPPALAPSQTEVATSEQQQTEVAATEQQTEVATSEQQQTEVATSEQQQTEVAATEQQAEAVAPSQESQPELAAAEILTTSELPVKKAAAKRAPRKTAARKATAAPPEQATIDTPAAAAPGDDASAVVPAVSDAGTGEAPVAAYADTVASEPVAAQKRPARRRTTKKAAADSGAPPEAPAPDLAATPDPVVTATVSTDEASGPAGWAQPTDAAVEGSADELEEDVVSDAPDLASTPTTDALVASADDDSDSVAAEQAPAETRDFGWLADPFAVPVISAHDDVTTSADADAEPGSTLDSTGTESEDDVDDAESDDDDSGDGGSRRRRRRRGGRRRRRGGAGEDASDSDEDAAEDEDSPPEGTGGAPEAAGGPAPEAGEAVDESDDESDGEDSEGQRRRRRRRRRRGEETAPLPDDPTDVVVRVREPRARKRAASTEVTGIEGSTRMEAKRQRRREGRDAGRRRAPILSEAEFLARRESVSRKMIIRQRADLAQIAVLEDGILVEHYVDRDSAASLIGNVYLGRVQNVLPSMEAAFVDIGRGRNAVLYAGEVDWDSFGADGHNRKVEKVLKSGQMILVQVTKDPVGAKGARLTNHVSLPGRYVVYAPGGHLSGISRKLPDVERRRLKDILADLVGEAASVIVRTAAEGASEDELVRDVNRLKAQWEDIERKVKAGNSPQLLYGEPDLTVRIVRDLFTEDFSDLIVQGNGSMTDAYDAIMGYVTHVAPHLQERIHRWEPDGNQDLFDDYRLDEQIAKALERKVFLPSGGSLVIDRTEAMTVIDVNTGKFTGTGGNLEATVTSNNLEAAEEIVRQMRLRDIGGIIVIDFIDMVLPNNRELLLRRLVECLGRDRTRHQVAEVTSLGLVQMTRKKIGTGLLEAFGTECPQCEGRGYEMHDMPVDAQKQADGGAREQRPRDYRGRSGDQGSRSDGTAKNGQGSRSDNGAAPAPEPADPNGSDSSDSSRSRRGRRGRGGSTGRDAADASTDTDAGTPEPAPAVAP
jgi:ribonuclease E